VPYRGYSVAPQKLEQHIETVREIAKELDTLAGPVAGLYPPGGPSWTGTEGGAALLRTCLNEIAEVLRRTGSGVASYAGRATQCLNAYDRHDKAGAANLRKCLIEPGR
jgi:hypothetical protein